MELFRCLRDPWGCLDSPAVTVCLWTSEIPRIQPFKLSSVSQQLATWIESFSYFLVSFNVTVCGPFSSCWSHFSFFCDPWDCLDSPAVTVCLWTSEIRRTRPFQLSSVSQQLATWVESFFSLLMGASWSILENCWSLVPRWWGLLLEKSVLYIICMLKIFSMIRHFVSNSTKLLYSIRNNLLCKLIQDNY